MGSSSNKISIYLAGGFRSGWQQNVHKFLPNAEILDPSLHGLCDPVEYTAWDLDAITLCDYVLAYMEEQNPGGYALALEVGYAKALGRSIVLVEEHATERRRMAFEMVRQIADHTFDTLADALSFLQSCMEDDRSIARRLE